jgi:hypothetical protein
MPPGTIDLRPGTIRIYVGDEIDTTGATQEDIMTLKEKARTQMLAMLS